MIDQRSTTPSSSRSEPLGDLAAARREAMLAVLLSAMQRRRRVRIAMRSSIVALALIGAASAAWSIARSSTTLHDRPDLSAQTSPEPLPPAPLPVQVDSQGTQPMIRIMHDDPMIVARLAIHSSTLPRSIGDDELLAEMAQSGLPSGLVRSGGRTRLVANSPPTIDRTRDGL